MLISHSSTTINVVSKHNKSDINISRPNRSSSLLDPTFSSQNKNTENMAADADVLGVVVHDASVS